MRSYAIGLLCAFLFIIIFSWSFSFVQDNLLMRENKNEAWKDFLYLGSNKGYTRTVGFDSDEVTYKDIYMNIMPSDVNYSADALYYEAVKDIADNSLINGRISFRIYFADNESPAIYLTRRIGDQTNVMKIELKEVY